MKTRKGVVVQDYCIFKPQWKPYPVLTLFYVAISDDLKERFGSRSNGGQGCAISSDFILKANNDQLIIRILSPFCVRSNRCCFTIIVKRI